MDKSAKVKVVEDLQENFSKATATFVADYKGLKALEMDEIRKALRDASIDFKVVRNTLARRAIKGTELETVSGNLKESTAIAFSYKDAAAAAKTLVQFSKEKPNLKLRVGTLGAKVITLAEIQGLAELPPKDVLLGKLLGSMKSPTTGLVMVLSGVPRKFLYALNAIKDRKAATA
ncbi:MAG TPA: 50S ribosomal protein L10 [Thermodesulfobacteriota bacterium]|nr:50S ribosomal protein L10 [Thermodesulfobacteriota bacterium]